MVSVIQRMRKLRALLAVRLGPGAAILPPEVTRIHMDFAVNITGGHYGAKRFWKDCLTRLKYHNPAVPMTVNRRAENHTGPALMTVHFASSDKERTKVLDMKNRDVSEIVAQLMTLTNAKPVKPTAEETRQLQELEEYRVKSAQDRERMKAVMEQRRREEAILTQARGEAEAMKET